MLALEWAVCSVVVNTSACHAAGRGSYSGPGALLVLKTWLSNTPFTLALLIRSETGFAPLRAFTLHQLIRINNLIRIKLNHLLEVVSHRFSLLRDLITSVDANRTRTKEEQIEINARGCICIYGVACQELSRSRSSARLSTKYHCKLSVAIL